MAIKIREASNISILDIEGKIDINSSEIIETVGWLTNTGKINILLNLENVELVDYSGLSILAIAYKNVVNHKGKMRFMHVSLPIIELFKIVKLESVFETYSDEESAISSFFDETAEKLLLRRKFKRLDIHISVKYKVSDGNKKPKTFDGKALNLSAAGTYVYTPYTFPINSQVDMKFNLPDSSGTFETTGRVVWLSDKELQPHYFPGMGVSFVHLTNEKEKAIIDFIDKNISYRTEP